MRNTVLQIITEYISENGNKPRFSYIQRTLFEKGEPQISQASFYRYLAEALEHVGVAESKEATLAYQFIKEFYSRAEMLELRAVANQQINAIREAWIKETAVLEAEIKRLTKRES